MFELELGTLADSIQDNFLTDYFFSSFGQSIEREAYLKLKLKKLHIFYWFTI